MACYAILVSLAQTIQHDIIHIDDQYSIFLFHNQQIRSLHELLILLNVSLKEIQLDSSDKYYISRGEYDLDYFRWKLPENCGPILRIAYAAKYLMKRIIAEDYDSYNASKPYIPNHLATVDKLLNHPLLYQQLQKVTQVVGRIANDATKKRNGFPTSQESYSECLSFMVDYDYLQSMMARLKSKRYINTSISERYIKRDDVQSFDILHERQQIKSLQDDIIFLQANCDQDIPEISNSLEGRIRDIAYETEDIIEYFMSDNSLTYSISNLNFLSYPHNFRQLCQELQRVREEFAKIAQEVKEMKNNITTDGDLHEPSNASSSSRPVLQPIGNNDAMVGFEDNLLAIQTRLCGQSSNLQVIPIFGMGGIGKTTLALNAFNDPLSIQHFEVRAWVTVSQDYNVNKILSWLMVVLKPFIKESTQKSTESLAVFQSLKGRRYLIVLDDMWSTKVWDDLKRLFPDDDNGSRIMLTTRLSDVAEYPTEPSSPLHKLDFIDLEQSWNMLRTKVFKLKQCPLELEYIGRTIANRCRGLPLAIVVVAGILSTVSPTEASWKNVAKNISSSVTTNDEQFAEILSLSYVHLPHHLRPCFLYMGGFPEDYEIKISKLIKLWVAEGFLKPSDSLSYEEKAEECLEDLIKRSLVLVTSRKPNGKIRSCNIHDLIRDLCIRKAQEEKFLLNAKKILPDNIKNERRVSINRSRRASVPYIHGASFRTILCFPPWHDMLSSLQDFRYLRVFDAVRLTFSLFPEVVVKLLLLRYLAFSISREVLSFEIPNSISHLQSLQTLFIFSSKTNIGYAKCDIYPSLSFWKMTQLRHLILLRVLPLPNGFATHILPLQNLQTLAIVMNFKCSKTILRRIPNLRKLEIVYKEDRIRLVTKGSNLYQKNKKDRIRWLDFELDNLVYLHQLEKLNIDVEKHRMDPVPFWENLAFPETLKQLKLRGFHCSSHDMAIVGSLPNLEVLKLRDCSFEDGKWETTEDEFPKLKILQIISTDLEHWVTESGNFSCLKRLMLCYCGNLKEIPDDIGEITTLELIEVCIQDKSLVESAKRIKEEQLSCYENDSLQVRVMNYYYKD